MTALFLDDERFPPDDGKSWVIVRTVEEAISYVMENSFPQFVSFDNDLNATNGQNNREGWEFANWLIDYDLDTGLMPDDFSYYVHSQNVAAAERIRSKLDSYLNFKRN